MTYALPLTHQITRSSTKKPTLRGISARLGEGYTQKAPLGLANTKDAWDISWDRLSLEEFNLLKAFFATHGNWDIVSFKPPFETAAKLFRASSKFKGSFDGLRHWSASISLEETTEYPTLSTTWIDPFPKTYSISPDKLSVDEGSSVFFTITTTNIPDGTYLYWITTGTVVAEDFEDTTLSGSISLIGNSSSINRTVAADSLTEGSETFRILLYTDVDLTNLVATSNEVTINDTSTTPELTVCSYGQGGIIATISGGHGIAVAASDLSSSITHADALSLCAAYNGGGYSDWRMMTYSEAHDILRYLSCLGWSHAEYWTSDTLGSNFRTVDMYPTGGSGQRGNNSLLYTRPVRSF